MPRFNKSPQAHAAEIIIPDSPLDHGGHYFPLPAAEQAVLHEASKLLAEQLPLSSGWHDVSTKDGIRLSKKPDSAQPNDVPWVRGVGILPYPPTAVVAVCTHPAFRMFWDERFVQGNSVCLVPLSSTRMHRAVIGHRCVRCFDALTLFQLCVAIHGTATSGIQ